MQTYQMYSIRDSKGDHYGPPFLQVTHGEAERYFDRLCKDPKAMISQYPDDFSLYHLGTFEDSTGLTKSLPEPSFIIKASTVLDRSKNNAIMTQ